MPPSFTSENDLDLAIQRAELFFSTTTRPVDGTWLKGDCFPIINFAAQVCMCVETMCRASFISKFSEFERASRGKPADFDVGAVRFSVMRRVNCTLALLKTLTCKDQKDLKLMSVSLVSRPEVQALHQKIVSSDGTVIDIVRELIAPPLENTFQRACIAKRQEKTAVKCLCRD